MINDPIFDLIRHTQSKIERFRDVLNIPYTSNKITAPLPTKNDVLANSSTSRENYERTLSVDTDEHCKRRGHYPRNIGHHHDSGRHCRRHRDCRLCRHRHCERRIRAPWKSTHLMDCFDKESLGPKLPKEKKWVPPSTARYMLYDSDTDSSDSEIPRKWEPSKIGMFISTKPSKYLNGRSCVDKDICREVGCGHYRHHHKHHIHRHERPMRSECVACKHSRSSRSDEGLLRSRFCHNICPLRKYISDETSYSDLYDETSTSYSSYYDGSDLESMTFDRNHRFTIAPVSCKPTKLCPSCCRRIHKKPTLSSGHKMLNGSADSLFGSCDRNSVPRYSTGCGSFDSDLESYARNRLKSIPFDFSSSKSKRSKSCSH